MLTNMNKDSLLKQSLKKIPPLWFEKIAPFIESESFKKLDHFLQTEIKNGKKIYPEASNLFNAFQIDFSDIKVVILGQDPYHGPHQAIGLSFAVPNIHFPKPPSLQNIFKEIKSDLNVSLKEGDSDLSGWVKQGVLLLNTVLSVEENTPLSHRNQGWEPFTQNIIEILGKRKDPIVFILWGSHAQKMKPVIAEQHAILESAHPSPLSAYRGFLGSKVFSKTNHHLLKYGKKPIQWEIISI